VTPNLGRILEFRLEPDGRKTPRIGCETKQIPQPGKYLVAGVPGDEESVLPVALFAQAILPDGFLAAQAFKLPGIIRNLALVAAGDTAARLLPLIKAAGSAALFTDLAVPDLPTHVEIQPLSGLPDAHAWADFIAIDLPLSQVDRLPLLLGGPDTGPVPPGQALVHTPMPCSGLAECGVCTLRKGWKAILLCVDGPVIDLGDMLQR
jgi:hypothetical protein